MENNFFDVIKNRHYLYIKKIVDDELAGFLLVFCFCYFLTSIFKNSNL